MPEKQTKDDQHLSTPADLDDKEEIAHLEGAKGEHGQHTTLIEEALALTEAESKLGLWQIFKLYYPGATYGLLLSLALVMEGYDTGLVSLAFGSCGDTLPLLPLTCFRSTTFSVNGPLSANSDHSTRKAAKS